MAWGVVIKQGYRRRIHFYEHGNISITGVVTPYAEAYLVNTIQGIGMVNIRIIRKINDGLPYLFSFYEQMDYLTIITARVELLK